MTSSQVEDFAIYARVNKKQKQRHRNRNLDDTSAPSTSYALSSTEMASQINTARPQRNESHDMEARYKNLIAASVDDRIDSSKSSSSDTIAAAQVATSKWGICKSQRFWIIALLIMLLMTVLLSCGIIAALSSEISNLKSDLNHTKEDLVSLEIRILGITTNMSHEIQGVITNETSHIHDKLSVIDNKIVDNSNGVQSNKKSIQSTSNSFIEMLRTASDNIDSLEGEATMQSSRIRDLRSDFSNLSSTFTEKIKQLNDTKANNNTLKDVTKSLANAVPLFSSCSDILDYLNTSMSGYYWLRSFNGAVKAYCNFTVSCNGITGGWMRIAKLTKNNEKAQCFQGMQNYGENASLCERKTDGPECSSNIFQVGIAYSQVCGQIQAYGLKSPDGFDRQPSHESSNNINDIYVDGVSLTYGNPPNRHHIWTFTPRVDSHTWSLEDCDSDSKPDFVGNYFTCMELLTANTGHPFCGGECTKSCPTSTNCSPEFYRNLVNQTSESIEMRVCTDQGKSDEDILIEDVEIYVQ